MASKKTIIFIYIILQINSREVGRVYCSLSPMCLKGIDALLLYKDLFGS